MSRMSDRTAGLLALLLLGVFLVCVCILMGIWVHFDGILWPGITALIVLAIAALVGLAALFDA